MTWHTCELLEDRAKPSSSPNPTKTTSSFLMSIARQNMLLNLLAIEETMELAELERRKQATRRKYEVLLAELDKMESLVDLPVTTDHAISAWIEPEEARHVRRQPGEPRFIRCKKPELSVEVVCKVLSEEPIKLIVSREKTFSSSAYGDLNEIECSENEVKESASDIGVITEINYRESESERNETGTIGARKSKAYGEYC